MIMIAQSLSPSESLLYPNLKVLAERRKLARLRNRYQWIAVVPLY
jgi:hypothetical protein